MTNGRCRMHGGKSRRGSFSPTFVHGLYSRDGWLRFAAVERFAPGATDRHPLSEAVRVALVARREGPEAAQRLAGALFMRRLERKYGSFEAACEAIAQRVRRTRL